MQNINKPANCLAQGLHHQGYDAAIAYDGEEALIQAEINIYDNILGAAGPVMIEYCREHKVELIAIATHGRSGLGRAVSGSVADHAIKHSNIPILLIRPAGDDKE